MEYRNDLELRIFHTKRGGGHAVINWLAHASGRQAFHLNNVFGKTATLRWRGRRVFQRMLEGDGGVYGVELPPETTWRELADMHKEVLIYNIENMELPRVAGMPLLNGEAKRIIGESRERRTATILRDAFNTFASVRRGKKRWQRRLTTFYRRHWKIYAREFLGETHHLPAGTMHISYNEWFVSELYRRRLAESFGFDYTEKGLDEVPQYGGGSSFEGRAFQNRASAMDVLNRWRHYANDPIYREALDAETIDLSNRIFGDITGGEIAPPG